MSDVLLDTHAFVWLTVAPARLSHSARDAIAAAPTIHLSVVSLYEIAFKRGRNRARGFGDELDTLPIDLFSAVSGLGVSIIVLTAEQAIAAGNLAMSHGDPWDRILVAQARDLGLSLVSADENLRAQAGDTSVLW